MRFDNFAAQKDNDMQAEHTDLRDLKRNEANPREIVDERFRKLVCSLLAFPKMLELRPIVCDRDGTVLGGNMRLAALLHISQFSEDELTSELAANRDVRRMSDKRREELRLHWLRFIDKPTAPVVSAASLTSEEKRQFIIKDNAAFGQWDWDALANEWDSEELTDWGVDVPEFLDSIPCLESGEKFETAKSVKKIRFENYSIEYTDKEAELFRNALDNYIAEFGVTMGFLNSILCK